MRRGTTEWDIGSILKSISTTIEKSIDNGNKKFKNFEAEFNKEFPKGSSIRGLSEIFIGALLLVSTSLELYFIGNNSALFVELHGLLERIALNDLPERLAKDEISKSIISKIIERKSLTELSEFLVELDIWNDEDLRFTRKLSNIRNGIAHKNAELVSKHLGDGKATSVAQIDEITQKVDCIPYILKIIKLVVKLVKHRV